MYYYEKEKQSLSTESGQRKFLAVRDRVHLLLKIAGSVRMQEAIQEVTGSSWEALACVDRLVELGEIREVTRQAEVAGQHRIFVSTGKVGRA